MKIRTAIFVVYVATSAVGFAVLMAFILREVRPRQVDAMRQMLDESAGLFAGMMETALADASGDAAPEDVWRERFAGLARSGKALRVYWTDRDDATPHVASEYDAVDELRSFLGERTGNGGAYAVVDGELRVTVPVRRNGEIAGYVGAARPLNLITNAIWAARVKLVFGALVIAVSMTAAGWWIANRLSRALERLTDYARRVRDGQEARPPRSRATEIAALSSAFEEMRRALEGRDYIARYTQALTHEIKAPLSAIRGAVELLDEGMPPEERRRFLQNIRAETARIQHIIDQLLQLSAVEVRHGQLKATIVDLAGIVDSAAADIRSLAETKGVELAVHRPVAPINVRGEEALLAMALANLVRNAVDFSPAGARVEVRCEAGDATASVTVVDAGPGIPGYAVDRVFERFFSLPRPDSGRKSTGLGLSLVREVATLHGGHVSLENRQPGPGARATFVLPRPT